MVCVLISKLVYVCVYVSTYVCPWSDEGTHAGTTSVCPYVCAFVCVRGCVCVNQALLGRNGHVSERGERALGPTWRFSAGRGGAHWDRFGRGLRFLPGTRDPGEGNKDWGVRGGPPRPEDVSLVQTSEPLLEARSSPTVRRRKTRLPLKSRSVGARECRTGAPQGPRVIVTPVPSVQKTLVSGGSPTRYIAPFVLRWPGACGLPGWVPRKARPRAALPERPSAWAPTRAEATRGAEGPRRKFRGKLSGVPSGPVLRPPSIRRPWDLKQSRIRGTPKIWDVGTGGLGLRRPRSENEPSRKTGGTAEGRFEEEDERRGRR